MIVLWQMAWSGNSFYTIGIEVNDIHESVYSHMRKLVVKRATLLKC